jgi:hypothetical protein
MHQRTNDKNVTTEESTRTVIKVIDDDGHVELNEEQLRQVIGGAQRSYGWEYGGWIC